MDVVLTRVKVFGIPSSHMTQVSGTRLGRYEILAPLGAGGMGEVYRARDTQLGRDVAIKVLPSHLALDPDLRERFEREAKAVAALTHPNILAIHDVGVEHGVAFAVVELLQGETLRQRLTSGSSSAQTPLTIRKAVDVAVQIARGLAAAHDKGIVHRDLKPENVFLTTDGQVKILDFGLARTPVLKPGDSDSPTQLRGTDPGTVMGTPGYMAPEQVRGQIADYRADIFALGCVLHEMLSGTRAFQRDTAAETMTAVLRDDPSPLSADGRAVPAPLENIVRHCLERKPEDRFQSARDLTFALESAIGTGSGSQLPVAAHSPAIWPRLRWVALTVLVAMIAGLGVWWAMRSPATVVDRPLLRAELSLPGLRLPFQFGKDDTILALSPDGRQLATLTPDHSTLMLRDLETGVSRTLVTGGELGEPIFSPDSRFVAFVQGGGGTIRTAVWGAIKKIAVTGGAATTIVDGIVGIKGADWADDGYIYYCPSPAMGLWRASVDRSSPPEKLTEPDAAHGEKTHRHPFVLPGSQVVLYTVGTSRIRSFDDARIEALRLSDRSRHRLIEGGTAPRYLSTGHLVYERAGQLLAVRFSPAPLTVSGSPVVVADGIADLPTSGTSYHTISATGLLAFIPRGPTPTGAVMALDREGHTTKLADVTTGVTSAQLSPDGRRLAIDPDGATQQIAILDLSRNLLQQVTTEWDNSNPLWTADASRFVFRSNVGGGVRRLYWQAADGTGKPEPLTRGDRDEVPTSLHGDQVLYESIDPSTGNDVWIVSIKERTPRPLIQTRFDEGGARLSPDGRFVVYQSNQSGQWEIWLQRFPATGSPYQVSQGGGVRGMWLPDGKSIVFQHAADVMMAAVSETGVGSPVKLFSIEPNDVFLDVTREGRILIRRTTVPPLTSLGIIVNWSDYVKHVAGE